MSCSILLPVQVIDSSVTLPIIVSDNSKLLGTVMMNCGSKGTSAYQQAVAGGYTGTESEFNTNLAKIDETTEKAETAVQPDDLPNITPTIGENGNWFVGDEDTGVQAEGQDGANLVTIAATTLIPFTALYVVMNQATISTNTVFTPEVAGAVSGSWVQQSIAIGATGISIQFDGFRKTANSCPVNAIVGEVYLLDFRYKDGNFWVTVSNENSDLAKKSETVTPSQAQTIAEQVVYNVISQPQDENLAGLGYYGLKLNELYNNSGLKRTGTLANFAGGGYYGEAGYPTTTVPFSNISDSLLFVHNKMKGCVLNDNGTVNYYLDENSNFNRQNVAPSVLGITTSLSTNKLICEGKFTGLATEYVGRYAHNTTSGKTEMYAMITAKDSDNQLSVDADFFVLGDTFEICTAICDGSDGMLMVEIPTIYIRDSYDNGIRTVDLSLYRYSGFDPHPAFVENGITKPHIYIGKFNGYVTEGKMYSRAGVIPSASFTLPQARTYAAARGMGWSIMPFWYNELLKLLFYAEYADLNSQVRLPGYTNRSQFLSSYLRKNGRTLANGNSSASLLANSLYDNDIVNDGFWSTNPHIVVNSFRGIENFYGGLWQLLDGVNIYNRNVYVTNNKASFVSDTASGYIDTELSLPATDGWIKTAHFLTGSFIPKSVGGASNYNFSDYVWQATGWRVAVAGSALSYGAYAGVAFLYANSASSSASAILGARLCF